MVQTQNYECGVSTVQEMEAVSILTNHLHEICEAIAPEMMGPMKRPRKYAQLDKQ